jgi:hypothetical protein
MDGLMIPFLKSVVNMKATGILITKSAKLCINLYSTAAINE